MQALMTVDRLIIILFFFCYAYQFVYIPVVLFSRKKTLSQPKKNRFAVLICARNEQAVIGDLIESLHHQTYDAGLIHLFVMADNCTDETAGIARSHGVTVYERFNN